MPQSTKTISIHWRLLASQPSAVPRTLSSVPNLRNRFYWGISLSVQPLRLMQFSRMYGRAILWMDLSQIDAYECLLIAYPSKKDGQGHQDHEQTNTES